MPIYEDKKNGTRYAMVCYKDWTEANKQKCQSDILKNSKFN